MADLSTLDFRVNGDWEIFGRENPWASFIPEFAKDSDGNNYMRPHGRQIVYKIVNEDDKGKQAYECAQCESKILATSIAHPIWDGPFPCSGSGQVHNEQVPYCPKCESVPNHTGIPISAR